MISDSDAKHLECVERAAFQPIGWLYQGIFERLLERGLVAITVSDAYIISDYGAAQLEAFRLEGLRRLAEHTVEKSMSNRTIADLCKRSHEMSRSKGWYNGEEKDPRSIATITLLMQSELIEALEEYRANRKLDEIYFSGPNGTEVPYGRLKVEAPVEKYKPEGILIELADLVIRVCQRCGSDASPLEAMINTQIPPHVKFTDDFETMLATCMADISMSYLVTLPAGQDMVKPAGFPILPESYWALTVAGVFAWAEQNNLDLWKAIEMKEGYNATREFRHGGKKI